MRFRRFWFGLATIAGARRRGWFIPYRYADTLPPAGARGIYTALLPRFEVARPRFQAVLDRIDGFAPELAAIGQAPPPAPRWNQDWFPRLDAAAAYAIVRSTQPARVVEIGSGHSTRFLARAVRDGGLATRITAIDPAPRAAIGGLDVTFLRQTVHQAGLAPFERLAAGDILFIDSSHILMPGSDVDLLFGHVLPRLAAGVRVHIHDIFLPDDYPTAWEWRGYNEQQGVIGLLQGGGFDLEFASHWVATRMAAALPPSLTALALPAGAFETSFWLSKAE
ncbi:class I SAM-dependent methyltransferase [Desertibaculum subflavum]|uniref:class I SAM-dependent methyltransferase n=1 Tax=Desertibaculum subflavum TaxID=2268458 RepID=UPI000E66B302